MTKTTNMRHGFILLVLVLSLFGCSKQEKLNELKIYVASLKQAAAKTKAQKIETGFQLPKPVVYEGSLPSEEANQFINKSAIITNPLQAYPLQSYQFVGTLSRGKQIWAYVIAPGNLVFQIKKGDVLSDQYGRIIDIAPNRLQILMKGETNGNHPVERVITMQLRERH
jgi:Tfp pilus assembly protein PilP